MRKTFPQYDSAPLAITAREAGRRLGLSYWTTRELILSGAIPRLKFPGKHGEMRRLMVSAADVVSFIEKSRVGA